ncbi:MAG: carboxypeptidase-like regulatory domain-containing protein [Candidatus Cyclobacteriaceae bacterium M3_2C_046]
MPFFYFSCQEDTIVDLNDGIIRGRVLDFETSAPIAGAGITTSPPSSAIVSGSSGLFMLENLEPGNYSVTAQKFGFQSSTVSVAVSEDEETEVVIFLEKKK